MFMQMHIFKENCWTDICFAYKRTYDTYLRLGVLISLADFSTSKLVAPHPITTKGVLDVTLIVGKGFV